MDPKIEPGLTARRTYPLLGQGYPVESEESLLPRLTGVWKTV